MQNDVTLRLLRYFTVLSQELNYRRAAESCSSPSPPCPRPSGNWKQPWAAASSTATPARSR
jgi:hypothetical protein